MGIKTMFHRTKITKEFGVVPGNGAKAGMSNEAISQKEDALKKFDKTLQLYRLGV